jgi:hypothetical protein
MGADGPTPDREQAGGQPDQASEEPSSDGADWAELDPRALDPDFGRSPLLGVVSDGATPTSWSVYTTPHPEHHSDQRSREIQHAQRHPRTSRPRAG